jgi:DNA topoisomerase-3
VLAALRSGEQKSTGKLHAELFPRSEMSRDVFEDVLGAMARAEVARLSDAVFEKDGKQIPYRTVRLTPAGRAANNTTPIKFIMKETSARSTKRKRKKKTPSAPKRRPGLRRSPKLTHPYSPKVTQPA